MDSAIVRNRSPNSAGLVASKRNNDANFDGCIARELFISNDCHCNPYRNRRPSRHMRPAQIQRDCVVSASAHIPATASAANYSVEVAEPPPVRRLSLIPQGVPLPPTSTRILKGLLHSIPDHPSRPNRRLCVPLCPLWLMEFGSVAFTRDVGGPGKPKFGLLG